MMESESDNFIKPTSKARKRKAKDISNSISMDTDSVEAAAKRPSFPQLSADKLTVSDNMFCQL